MHWKFVLRKICKSLMLCEDGKMRGLESDGVKLLDAFTESMVVLATDMSGPERERYKDEGFYENEDLKDVTEEDDMIAGKDEKKSTRIEPTTRTPDVKETPKTKRRVVIDLDADDDVQIVDDW